MATNGTPQTGTGEPKIQAKTILLVALVGIFLFALSDSGFHDSIFRLAAAATAVVIGAGLGYIWDPKSRQAVIIGGIGGYLFALYTHAFDQAGAAGVALGKAAHIDYSQLFLPMVGTIVLLLYLAASRNQNQPPQA